MEKGLGIAGLVLAILAIVVPVYGIFVSGIALILVTIAALGSERIFTTATVLIAAVNTFALSPSVWIVLSTPDSPPFLFAILLFLAAPIVAMFLNATGRYALNLNQKPPGNA